MPGENEDSSNETVPTRSVKSRPILSRTGPGKFKAWTAAHFKRRQSRQRALNRTRMFYLWLGWPILIVGALVTPLPFPIGIPMMIVGLFMLARGSHWVREKIIRTRRKWPQFSAKLNALKTAMPAPIRRFLLRTDPHLYRNHHKPDSEN